MLGSAHLLSYYTVFGMDTLVTGYHKMQFIGETTLITGSKSHHSWKLFSLQLAEAKAVSEWEIMACRGCCYACTGAGWSLGNLFPLPKGKECFMAPQTLSWCPVQHKRLRERWKLGKLVYKGSRVPALEGLQSQTNQMFCQREQSLFLDQKWQTQVRVSHVMDWHSRPAITLPNVFSIVVSRQKWMILGSLAVLVLLHFGFRF